MPTWDHQTFLLPFYLFLLIGPCLGFFGWLSRSPKPTPAPDPDPAPDLRSLQHVAFEMTTADERFLAEAQRLHLSPLDSCHHKVIAQLRSSCTDLTEEELAKLGVSLFNCQAGVEGRRTYLCTPDMTLAECTAEMDPDTWNAYHIVSNRARAVCYATRQMQFKLRAEHTVNALVSTAAGQLEAMEILKSGQEELRALTSESLQRVVGGQERLLAQQEAFQGSQEHMEESIQRNLAQLAQEKALIASGQQQVAQLIEGITRRMENVSTHLSSQDADLQEGHRAILRDLSQVQKRAQEVYAKIESNLGLFAAYQNQTGLYYEELMGKLQKMNESLGLVLFTMERMQSNVEGQLRHIQRFIHWAGFSLSSIYFCLFHGCYFLLAALVMTFLQIPGLPRIMLLVLVVANALLELNHTVSLGFNALTIFLVLAVAGNWLLGRIVCYAMARKEHKHILGFVPFLQENPEMCVHEEEEKSGNHRVHVTSTPERDDDVDFLKEELEELEESSYRSDATHLGTESSRTGAEVFPPLQRRGQGSTTLFSVDGKPPQGPSPHTMSLRRPSLSRSVKKEVPLDRFHHLHLGSSFYSLPISRCSSPNESMASDMSTCSASPRPRCQAVTRTGQPCRKRAIAGHSYCHVHESGQSSYVG
nr:PREDICTED: LOW QUALITY PROTEIN: protein brambleberry [Anolis carolinensis]|eukprot:XP_008119123.1 PREDICTED: LOW QUALITY PROTEIN: protein brambleberry [Anolis carolinensis]